ncbi:GIY-YIG nuclease family protein [Candidatus Formimonas warabiya]|uniref:Bacteriophage T5 Orf172 DNA-binding domain-containing protein n=1 Tax=Formimonas warabiya TaxID=1761012 RepID=A0A3G1KNW0_FORW1|nr:GIY-YIG nuclease family protein [Candidatus Formimonas warabiya]ATW24152.1 hypothetical protein DCMF_04575 [Candidatus Formimonas warabiya]
MFSEDPINIWSYVYFIQAGYEGPIKIGSSNNVEKRLNSLQTSCPDKLMVLHFTTGGRALEKYLHKKFEKHVKHGEWFSPDQEILDYIVEIKHEDEFYGRPLSIVEFALNNGFELSKDDWEVAVLLTRGGMISSYNNDHINYKLKFWKLLDAYWEYLKHIPSKLYHKREITCLINEGYGIEDKEIKRKLCIPF